MPAIDPRPALIICSIICWKGLLLGVLARQPAHHHRGHHRQHLAHDVGAKAGHGRGLFGDGAADVLGAENPAENVVAVLAHFLRFGFLGMLEELLVVARPHLAEERLHGVHRVDLPLHALAECGHQRLDGLAGLIGVQTELARQRVHRRSVVGLIEHVEHVEHLSPCASLGFRREAEETQPCRGWLADVNFTTPADAGLQKRKRHRWFPIDAL